YRILPVSVTLLVDQMAIPRILTELSNANFDFVITQVNISVPEKAVELPFQLRDMSAPSSTAGAAKPEEEKESEEESEAEKEGEVVAEDIEKETREDAIFNTMKLDVYGRMRIYEMPPAMVEEFNKAIENK